MTVWCWSSLGNTVFVIPDLTWFWKLSIVWQFASDLWIGKRKNKDKDE